MLEDMFGLVITTLVDICVSKPTYRTNTPGFIVLRNDDWPPIGEVHCRLSRFNLQPFLAQIFKRMFGVQVKLTVILITVVPPYL